MERICIIIPCYNEAERFLTDDFLNFIRTSADMDFCFVNDGSKDHTIDKLLDVKQKAPGRIEVVTYTDNRGKAEAVREGFLKMSVLNKYQWLAFADADLATPLHEIERLIRIAQSEKGCMIVMGSRIAHMGGTIQRKFYRHITGRIFAGVVSLLFSLNAHDTQCGAKVFRADIADEIIQKPFISHWLFDIEMLLRVRNLHKDYNQRIKEVPLNVWIEQGNSKIRFSHLLRMPFQLWKIYFEYRK